MQNLIFVEIAFKKFGFKFYLNIENKLKIN